MISCVLLNISVEYLETPKLAVWYQVYYLADCMHSALNFYCIISTICCAQVVTYVPVGGLY